MKKILIVLPGMYFGGMERVSFIARERLLANGYDVDYVTLFRGDPDYKPDFEYTSLDCEIKKSKIGKVLTTIQRIKKLKSYKKKTKPDCVIAYGQNANFCNVFSRYKEKVIIGIRSYDWLYNYFFNYKIEKMIYDKADQVIAVSRLIQVDAEEIFNIDKQKSDFLYNPYDLELINGKASEDISEIAIPEDKIVLVSAGRLENQKGFYHLIKALSLFDSSNIKLYILGHGGCEKDLRHLINSLNLEDVVTLMGGQSNPYKFMKKADLYVMPSISEGFPNALVEAMSVGTPVLSADCLSGPREILTEDDIHKRTVGIEYGKYGILVEAMTDSKNYDPSVIEDCDRILADAIKTVTANKELMKEYGRLAQERASVFSYEAFEKKLLKLIG
ncbi:glycosyltransferase [Enterococcus cecorum]|nr:glycosyltransferase [Enterococcus cecorum]CAI3304458.1 glycosyltransferase [Enterococcus cecorum]